ncbi:hypothetical protein [Parvicella tangerina]|uniref:Uncharacterized protein n=1 Tax=Parvicella tangerina TaxID=2829795 RepID=A0A916JM41_9FLAO|nr:hypothetical protein [Parvicella tangerina]CAG5082237.1 hypothetical protein CRYO30217_01849 [Parvicella tangerina]
MKTNRNRVEIQRELIENELRKRFTIKWLKQFKGFEKVSKRKAKQIIENMIELTLILTSSVIKNK